MVTASADTPAPVLDKLNEILNAVLAEPEFRKKMLERNILPRPGHVMKPPLFCASRPPSGRRSSKPSTSPSIDKNSKKPL